MVATESIKLGSGLEPHVSAFLGWWAACCGGLMESPGVGFGPAGKGASPCQVFSPLGEGLAPGPGA